MRHWISSGHLENGSALLSGLGAQSVGLTFLVLIHISYKALDPRLKLSKCQLFPLENGDSNNA